MLYALYKGVGLSLLMLTSIISISITITLSVCVALSALHDVHVLAKADAAYLLAAVIV